MENSRKFIKAAGVNIILLLFFATLTSMVMFDYKEDYCCSQNPDDITVLEAVNIYPEYYFEEEEEPELEDWMFKALTSSEPSD